MTTSCGGCGSEDLEAFYEVEDVPVQSVLLMYTREEALELDRRDIGLALCRSCGLISNVLFDRSTQEYSTRYEETQGFSETFQAFHRALATDLIGRFDLRGKRILEIGCGKGEFLALLCELGDNRGVGFDPAFVETRMPALAAGRVTYVADYYDERYAGQDDSDFICCKMTLEHIDDVRGFVGNVRRAIGGRDSAVVFFQVPDARRILRDAAFWDVYYEHCSYFCDLSLSRVFQEAGFGVIDVWTGYDDQYLMLAAKPVVGAPVGPLRGIAELIDEVDAFATRVSRARQAWRRALLRLAGQRRRVVLWGAGSKAVAFLTTLGIGEEIVAAVDVNPYKHGTFLAGSGHLIVGPDEVGACRPDIVILMNPVYRNEIGRTLASRGLHPTLISVHDVPT